MGQASGARSVNEYKVRVVIEDGVVSGVFSSDPNIKVEIWDIDDYTDKEKFWEEQEKPTNMVLHDKWDVENFTFDNLK